MGANEVMNVVLRISRALVVVLYCGSLFVGISNVIDAIKQRSAKTLSDSLLLIFVSSAITALVLGVAK